MINYFKVHDLNGGIDVDARLHPDVNIITGENGSGKTSMLKLMWYCLSSNLERIFREISFSSCELETANFRLLIACNGDKKQSKFVTVRLSSKAINMEFTCPAENYERETEKVNQALFALCPQTIMFPTFRRIEGGFSIGTPNRIMDGNPELLNNQLARLSAHGEEVQDGLESIAGIIAQRQHKFVTSISTNDIKSHVTSAYSAVSHATNRKHSRLTDRVNGIINKKDPKLSAEQRLELISSEVKSVSAERDRLLNPFHVLHNAAKNIFNNKGIRLTKEHRLGDLGDAVDSDRLSSGEKQMLSFLCYNAFTQNGIIFIDEPELSLHVNWQRDLVSFLREQNSSNQLIMATHSPFIYSKYEDREIILKRPPPIPKLSDGIERTDP